MKHGKDHSNTTANPHQEPYLGLTSRLPCSAAAAAATDATLLLRGSTTSDSGLLASATSHSSASVSAASGSGCSATWRNKNNKCDKCY